MPGQAGVIVLGEVIADVTVGFGEPSGSTLPMTAHAGGSPANVAVALARLGVPARFVGRISGDLLGRFLHAHLEHSGVDLGLSLDVGEPCTMAMVGVDDTGAPAYSFYTQGTADWQWQRAELPSNDGGAAIHTGSLAIALEPGASILAAWVAEQRARGDVFVSLDPNVRPGLVLGLPGYRERLDSLIGHAQLVKVSDEDLHALEPGVEPLETAMAWLERGPQLVIVTHGARGATAVVRGARPVFGAAIPISAIDTIGAGDAFTAGLLASLAEHHALCVGWGGVLDRSLLVEVLGFAGRVAAFTCSRAGADPPWRAELDLTHTASPL